MECQEKKIGRKNLTQNKEEAIGPGTSKALKTDWTTVQSTILTKRSPSRHKAPVWDFILFVQILCSPINKSRLIRGPSFNRDGLFLILW